MPTVRKTKFRETKKAKKLTSRKNKLLNYKKITQNGGIGFFSKSVPNKPVPKKPVPNKHTSEVPVTPTVGKYKITNTRTQGTTTDKLSTALRARHALFERVKNISSSSSNISKRLEKLQTLRTNYFTSNSNSKLKVNKVLRNKHGKSLLQRMKNYALIKIAPQHLYNQEVYKGDMCSHSKGVLRKMIIAEDEFELRQQTKEDRMSKWVGL
jgi:hypothetical protein